MKPLMNPYLATLLISLTAQSALADQLVDPTRPVGAKDAANPTNRPVRLEAILRAEDRLLAIVNGKIVRAGDRIGDTRIDEILADSVRYTRSGRSEVARLSNKSIPVRQNVAATGDET